MTNTDMPSVSAAEFSARMAVHGASWRGVSGLVVENSSPAEISGELAQELRFVAEIEATTIAVERDLDPMLTALRHEPDGVLVLHGFSALDPEAWQRLDALRNLFQAAAGLVLVLRPADLEALQEHAPNFSSWLGARVWRLADDTHALSTAEVDARLATLRAAFGRTDDEVLALARARQLPPEPEFAEWLILLGHGDLVP